MIHENNKFIKKFVKLMFKISLYLYIFYTIEKIK